jgi:hypothetical protein
MANNNPDKVLSPAMPVEGNLLLIGKQMPFLNSKLGSPLQSPLVTPPLPGLVVPPNPSEVVVHGLELSELKTQIPPLVVLQVQPAMQVTPAQGFVPVLDLSIQAPL